MRIEHYEGLNRTPALHIAVRGWLELLDQHLAGDTIVLNWDHNAFVAFEEEHNRPVGVITYAPLKWVKEYSICVGYVLPEWRGLDVYDSLWDKLIERARSEGVVVISSATRLRNEWMRRVAKRQQREEVGVMLEFRL